MPPEGVEKEQVYKTDDFKLGAFLLSSDCKLDSAQVRNDNKVEFFISGPKTLELVKEFDSHSKNTLIRLHEFWSAVEHLRDVVTRTKGGHTRKRRERN